MKIIHHHFETIDSTNDFAKKNLSTFSRRDLTIISADEQTKGRGRYGRSWFSPKGENLYSSFCFFVDKDQQDSSLFTHISAISLSAMLKKYGICNQIKWPNDILVNQKKLAGILCETELFPPQTGIIVGIGLNINMNENNIALIDQPTTSLKIETSKSWDISLILNDIANLFISDVCSRS